MINSLSTLERFFLLSIETNKTITATELATLLGISPSYLKKLITKLNKHDWFFYSLKNKTYNFFILKTDFT